ncbi:MAG: hypothetical protein OEW89_12360 [Gammaproteobacteria bacterium]|nr:hypothetical protein [Gammaproteobacteria bacterium]MDH5593996.1 hypothetical protein [Gammaproteobacteria bacterium]
MTDQFYPVAGGAIISIKYFLSLCLGDQRRSHAQTPRAVEQYR